MIEKLFLQILNMSFVGSIVILIVLTARLFLKKAPKIFSYSLWAVVLLRLLFPFSFESVLSLIPVNPEPISKDFLYTQTSPAGTDISGIDNRVNSSFAAGTVHESVNAMQTWISIGASLWVVGVLVLFIYSLVTLIKLKSKLEEAVHEKDNIYLSSVIDTPFVLGVFRPKIFLPTSLTKSEREYILLHEQTHIRRFDHVLRIISYFALYIHWFNPLVWIAFYVSGKDMEMSCDESVIEKLGDGVKKDYSTSLLVLATGRRNLGATPLTFGEGDTKGRIKNVMRYRKPMFWVVAVAMILIVVVCVGLITNPQMITLPQVDVIEKMEMEKVNKGSTLSSVTVIDGKSIEAVISNLSGGKKTMWQSTNDYPTHNNYLMVRLIQKGERRTFYLYSDNGSYYIEEPYVGIYKTDRDASVEIDRVYMGVLESHQRPKSAHIGFISDFATPNPNLLNFDQIEWITLEDTKRMEELGIQSSQMPNGYYIHNPKKEAISFKLTEDTEYNFVDWGKDFVKKGEDRHYSTKNKKEFIRYLNTYSDKAAKVPFWIELKDGQVLSITEQFVN